MTIRDTTVLPMRRCIEIRREQRYGNLFEDDMALSIRRFHINYVYEVQHPEDPSGKIRCIGITESESEYEYWYCLYGRPYDDRTTGMKHYSNFKSIDFDMTKPYTEELAQAVWQTQLSGVPDYESHVSDAISNATYCEPFNSDSL